MAIYCLCFLDTLKLDDSGMPGHNNGKRRKVDQREQGLLSVGLT